ncbi:Protein of unknown function [Devosia enhydra]|uniref:DUF3486 family protein n=1 Tax=Devosia enhydra TaxID=665118 RepID=A0A1K2I0R9_9HYPH|nr:DUF3486 family protein [Devosia enhydra]SFZ85989.1 Protein of unknown function [Devosia enhydra]
MSIRQGRGRVSAIEQLPPEADPIIAWAADELRDRNKTQLEIYQEFFDKLQRLQAEHRGELDFAIPSKSAFNRYSIRLATMTRRLEEVREIAGSIARRFDAGASDDLTIMAAEAIKTLVWEVLSAAGEASIDPKGAAALANALRHAVAAQGLSTARRQKVEADFAAKAADAVSKVAKVKGLTTETEQAILSQILGVER